MADERWLVIEHPDGRTYEVADVDYERFGPDNWPGFKVTGYKAGGSYTKKAAEAAADENAAEAAPAVVLAAQPAETHKPAAHASAAKTPAKAK